ncbi:hypothetical protein PPYR_08947 [Photinus pyralis]|uniref:Asparagine synthetase [glutamine-hydrolyzing] n=2 Tax=Photinus pyralis TaxID=7054 RepID=A0A1Y1KR92_PHOPY|nr:asparagine synthetase domain-containing protein CG17486 [Photinus pyralis]KAB0797954.1 hypothetical protein PPYR_08947 [Photinus pyralis]
MCGIFCMFEANSHDADNCLCTYNCIQPTVNRRGPDYHSSVTLDFENHSFVFGASVLWLQGKEMTKQPVENEQSVFIFNGDIFGGTSIPSDVRKNFGDTIPLLHLLEKSEDVIDDLMNLQGPYSFVYLNKKRSKLYFGRDPYGRRSLLIGMKDSAILLTSVATRMLDIKCVELPAVGIFTYSLETGEVELLPWPFRHSNFKEKVSELETILNKTIKLQQNLELAHHTFINPTDNYLQYPLLSPDCIFSNLLNDARFFQNVQQLEVLLEKAIEKRIATQPAFCHKCIKSRNPCIHSTTGVLFSGGVDCAILALLADKYCSKHCSIDLLNVSFSGNAPDRQTGLQTLDELKQIRPERKWNFVEINVKESELNLERERRIADLIYPLNTILDDSLGCALWFASRGQTESYVSPCRVLLVGMGADELFGGYTKHRAALKRGGWQALHEALEIDWQNISFRNLARDDRVVSDHGRQLRTPYLDEEVVEFVRSLNCWERTCPSDNLQQGVGEKVLLRSLAYHLGLKKAASLRKRALQFGSRIANSKENAHDVSARLKL